MYIVGSAGSGKTYALLKIIETVLFQEFTYIFLICPTYQDNKTYQEWRYKDDPKFIVLDVTQDDVETYLSLISKNYRNTNSLVILDDCASCQSVKNRTSSLVEFAFHGRHAGFSTVVISQQSHQVSGTMFNICWFFTHWMKVTGTQFLKVFYQDLQKNRGMKSMTHLEKNIIHFHIARGVKRLIVPNKDVILFNN